MVLYAKNLFHSTFPLIPLFTLSSLSFPPPSSAHPEFEQHSEDALRFLRDIMNIGADIDAIVRLGGIDAIVMVRRERGGGERERASVCDSHACIFVHRVKHVCVLI
jgi:hypothetical protein